MRLLALLLFLCASAPLAPASSLAGTWRIDVERSTELSPWRSYDLVITIAGDHVTLDRRLAWGRRVYEDTTAISVGPTINEVPADFWPDNRHLGAYLGGDRTKRIRAEWLDDRRILRLSADYVLDTQQGPRAVNTLSDYKVSPNGARLTLIELRSTRPTPITTSFTRVTSP